MAPMGKGRRCPAGKALEGVEVDRNMPPSWRRINGGRGEVIWLPDHLPGLHREVIFIDVAAAPMRMCLTVPAARTFQSSRSAAAWL